jgi:hypothetical protein
MPLPVPTLDDRTFDQLVSEGRALIPRYAPDWTNYNVSDPGITLLELFAYFTETSLYELDQIPDEAIKVFLELMATCPPQGEPLSTAIARTLARQDMQERAVTAHELLELARRLGEAESPQVDRLEHTFYIDDACADEDPTGPFAPEPSANLFSIIFAGTGPTGFALEDRMYRALRDRALLATRIHVAQPPRVRVKVTATAVRRVGQALDPNRVDAEIRRFLSPLHGGPHATGWPLGRTVYVSELYQLLEGMPEVDHVEALQIAGPPAGPIAEGVQGLEIPLGTLVDADPSDVTVLEPT